MQTRDLGIYSTEHVFVTHHHHDHITGLKDLYHTTRDTKVSDIRENKEFIDGYFGNSYQLYLSPYSIEVLEKELPYIMESEQIVENKMEDNSTVSIGGTTITSFIAEHTKGYRGFIIEGYNNKIVYRKCGRKPTTDVKSNCTAIVPLDECPLGQAEKFNPITYY